MLDAGARVQRAAGGCEGHAPPRDQAGAGLQLAAGAPVLHVAHAAAAAGECVCAGA